MSTQQALMFMDQEVAQVTFEQDTLSIDAAPERGFSLFYVTFDGILQMKQQQNEIMQDKRYKLSFMVEGVEDGPEAKVTVKASKMNIFN